MLMSAANTPGTKVNDIKEQAAASAAEAMATGRKELCMNALFLSHVHAFKQRQVHSRHALPLENGASGRT
jgi:hypothetical protein